MAILDRLLHHSHVLNIKGRSYRLRDLEDALNLAHALPPRHGRARAELFAVRAPMPAYHLLVKIGGALSRKAGCPRHCPKATRHWAVARAGNSHGCIVPSCSGFRRHDRRRRRRGHPSGGAGQWLCRACFESISAFSSAPRRTTKALT